MIYMASSSLLHPRRRYNIQYTSPQVALLDREANLWSGLDVIRAYQRGEMDIPKVFKSFIEVLSLMNNKSNLEQHLERTDQSQQQLNKRPSKQGIDDLGEV